ncbi:MAG: hypothetical protein ACKOE6_11720, partial [Flammeovirgaceae bacterium]
LFTFVSAFDTSAQNTSIVLKDSTKVKTEITALSENLLFTKAGSFSLSEIYSIRFATKEEYENKEVLASILRTYAIIVYRANERLSMLDQQTKLPEPVAKTTISDYSKKPDNEFNSTGVIGDFGVGLGLDYGGIGGRLTLLPSKNLGVFVAGGYAFAGFGFNTGLNFRATPDKRASFIANVMYGYHAAYAVSGAPQLDKFFYGVSAGVGVMVKQRRNVNSFWTIELLVPFRSKEATDYYNVLKSTPGIRVENALLPVAFSFGYHFSF